MILNCFNSVLVECSNVSLKRLLTAIGVLFVTSSVAMAFPSRGASMTSHRWVTPCSGSVPVDGVAMTTVDDAWYHQEGRESRGEELIDWPTTLSLLSDKSNALRKNVRDLKKLYVHYRFRDESLARDLDNLGVGLGLNGIQFLQRLSILDKLGGGTNGIPSYQEFGILDKIASDTNGIPFYQELGILDKIEVGTNEISSYQVLEILDKIGVDTNGIPSYLELAILEKIASVTNGIPSYQELGILEKIGGGIPSLQRLSILDKVASGTDGIPSLQELSVEEINKERTIVLRYAFEYLARFAVYIEQARIDESLANSDDKVSFDDSFRLLEDDQDHGLYWLLCSLDRLLYVTGSAVSNDVVDDIMQTRVLVVDRNSLRHARDYIILRNFENVLEQFSVYFGALSYLYTHP